MMDLNIGNQGPIWEHRDRQSILQLLPFDGCNSGPTIYHQRSQNSDDSTEITNNDFFSSLIENQKKSNQYFPIQKSCNAWPFHSKSKEFFNYDESSFKNLLSSFELYNSNYLLHPKKDKKNTVSLYMSEVIHDRKNWHLETNNVCQVAECHQIDNIESAVYNSNAYALLHCDNEIQHIRLDDLKVLSKVSSPSITACSLHQTFSDHFFVSSSNSCVQLFCDQNTDPVWKCYINKGLSETPRPLWCKAADHPFSVFASNEENLWVFDTRTPESFKIHTIFSLKNMKSYALNDDSICSFINVPNTPFVYLNCTHTTLLMDRRHCKSPILSWAHMLDSNPAFPVINTYQDKQILAMADFNKHTTCCIATSWNPMNAKGNNVSIKGISFPKHFQHFDRKFLFDQAESFKNSNWFEIPIQKRIYSNFVGMQAINSNEKNFVLCYLNNYGDIIIDPYSYLEESETHYSVEKYEKCLRKFGKDSISACSEMENLIYIPGMELSEIAPRRHKVKGMTFHAANFVTSYWNIDKTLSSLSKVRTKRNFLTDNFISEKRSISSIDSNATDLINYLPKEYESKIDSSYIKSFQDSFSSKFRSIWEDSEEVDQKDFSQTSGYFFGTQPVDLPDVNIKKVKTKEYLNLDVEIISDEIVTGTQKNTNYIENGKGNAVRRHSYSNDSNKRPRLEGF